MGINLYPEMNGKIADIIGMSEEPMNLYASAYIKQLQAENARLREQLEAAVVLPCKAGDTVYFTKSAFSMAAFPIDAKITSIRGINCDGEVMYAATTNYNKIDRTFTSGNVGNTVFLTREAAENALKGNQQCKHKTADDHCVLHSDDEVKEYCLEGPCPDEECK